MIRISTIKGFMGVLLIRKIVPIRVNRIPIQ